MLLLVKLVSSNEMLNIKEYVVDSPVLRISSVINAAEFSKTTATDPNTYTETYRWKSVDQDPQLT